MQALHVGFAGLCLQLGSTAMRTYIKTNKQDSASETKATQKSPQRSAGGFLDSLSVLPTSTMASAAFREKLPPALYVGSLVINVLALALPLALLQIYDRIIPNEALDTLSILMGGLVIALLIDGVFKAARAHLVAWHAARMEHKLNVAAVDCILQTPASALEKQEAGSVMDQINAVQTLREFEGGQSRLLILDLPFVLMFLGLVWVIGGPIVIVPIVMFALLAVATLITGKAQRAVLQDRAQLDDRRYSFVIETLTGIHSIKAMSMEPQMQRRYDRLLTSAAEVSYRTISLGGVAQAFGNSFSSLTMVAVVSTGAWFVIDGSLSIGSVAACTLLSGRTVQPLLRGLQLWSQIQNITLASDRLRKVFDLPQRADLEASEVPEIAGIIEFVGVTHQYEDSHRPVLDDFTLKLEAGSMIAITGREGCGKSSMMEMITGDMAPSQGDVMIDGIQTSGPHRAGLAQHIAYIPPDPVVFRGSIIENLAMFRTGDAIDDARAAARLIGLETEINKLPNGYDTRLNETISEELSKGFLQLIVIARAIAAQPKIILFDEANNNLDNKSDQKVVDALKSLKGGPTIIAVTHRPSLMRIADSQFELFEGKLREWVDPAAAYRATQAAEATASETTDSSNDRIAG